VSEPQGYTQAVVDILNSQLGQSITQAFTAGEEHERERIINLLIDLNAIRRDALGSLVAFNTDGTEVIYLPGLENK